MNETEQIILESARKFDELEKQFLKYTYETKKPQNFEELQHFFEESVRLAIEAFDTQNDILENFINIRELNIIDQNVLNILDSIRDGKKYYSISYYENWMDMVNKGKESFSDRHPTSIYEILHEKFSDYLDDFHARFDLVGYYFDKITVGPIISSSKIPEHLINYFEELKETYAFGQYRSSIALCRALLEMALFHKLTVRGAFRTQDTNITNINVAKEDNLNRYINMAKWNELLSESERSNAHEIRKKANDILHAKNSSNELNGSEIIDTISLTINIIEKLYR